MYKERVQVSIMPRIFKGLKISYKGDYFFRLEVIHRSVSGKIQSAYPYIYQANLPKQTKAIVGCCAINISKQKKPFQSGRTVHENNKGFYETSAFDVQFETHLQSFKEMCVFQLEYKLKREEQRGQIVLILSVVSQLKTLVRTKGSDFLQQTPHLDVILTRQILINPYNSPSRNDLFSAEKLNFLKIEIHHNDFFGTLSMYIDCSFHGFKIRQKGLNLCEFLCCDSQFKRKSIQKQRSYVSTKIQSGRLLRELSRNAAPTIQSFLSITIGRLLSQLQYLTVQNKLLKGPKCAFYEDLISDWLRVTQNILHQNCSYEELCEHFQSADPNNLYFRVHYEHAYLGSIARQIWQSNLTQIVNMNLQTFMNNCHANDEFNNRLWREKCICYIKSNQAVVNSTNQISIIFEERSRLVEQFDNWKKQHITKLKLFHPQLEKHPLFFVQSNPNPNYYATNKSSHQSLLNVQPEPIKSLVVFIHGFKGSQYDLQKASQILLRENQNTDTLRISSIQNDIDYTIQQMAGVVATQIRKYILTSFTKYQSISLIGYSLGGVLARACLPHLSAYREKFNILVTFSSPHLGTYSADNKFVKFGIWYMTKFGKCTVLQELNTCRDVKSSSKSYLKKLSQQKQIGWFKKIVLVSCLEDEFVPHSSARIITNSTNSSNHFNSQNCEVRKSNSHQDIFDEQMAQMGSNILKNAKLVERVEIWFDNKDKKGTLDKLTGRQAHIEFLENSQFHKVFFQLYASQL